MKNSFRLMIQLILHPIQSVKSADLLLYNKSCFYLLGIISLTIVIFLNNSLIISKTSVSIIFHIIVAVITYTVFVEVLCLFYFVLYKFMRSKVKYVNIRIIIKPPIIIGITGMSVIHIIKMFLGIYEITFLASILFVIWISYFSYLIGKFKLGLSNTSCILVFIISIISGVVLVFV